MPPRLTSKSGNKGFLHIIEAVISFLIVISYITLVLSGLKFKNNSLLWRKESIISKELDSIMLTNASLIFSPKDLANILTVFGMKKIELYDMFSKAYILNNSCVNITSFDASPQELDIFCGVCDVKIIGPENQSLKIFDFYNLPVQANSNYSVCSYGSKTLLYLRGEKEIYSYGNSSLVGNINAVFKLIKIKGKVYFLKVLIS